MLVGDAPSDALVAAVGGAAVEAVDVVVENALANAHEGGERLALRSPYDY